MGKKTKLTIYVDSNVIQKAKEIGLNLSKTCENALVEAIRRLESPISQNTAIKTNNSKKADMVGRAGFEPATSSAPGWNHDHARRPPHNIEDLIAR